MSLSQGSAFIVFSKSGDLMYPLEASWFPVFISIWLLSLGTSLTLSPSQVSWLSRICLQFLLILDSFPPHLGYSKLLSFKTNVKSHFLKKYFPIPQSNDYFQIPQSEMTVYLLYAHSTFSYQDATLISFTFMWILYLLLQVDYKLLQGEHRSHVFFNPLCHLAKWHSFTCSFIHLLIHP